MKNLTYLLQLQYNVIVIVYRSIIIFQSSFLLLLYEKRNPFAILIRLLETFNLTEIILLPQHNNSAETL